MFQRTPPRRLVFSVGDDDDGGGGAPATPDGAAPGGTALVDVLALADTAPYAVRGDLPMGRTVPLFRKLSLEYVVVVDAEGRALGLLERIHLLEFDLDRLERVALAAGDVGLPR